MINLALRDISYGWGRYLLTATGLGLLIGVTLIMAGVYRGMVDDGTVLLESSGADIWVAQQYTLGPYAESSVLHDDVAWSIAGLSGVGEVGNVTYLTMQVKHSQQDVRVMIAGFEQGRPGEPTQLIAGRPIMRSSYEVIADSQAGFKINDKIQIRRHEFTVVGLTKRRVSFGGDPMLFITLKDAQQVQFLKDNEAVNNDRVRITTNPGLNYPGLPGLTENIINYQLSNHNVNAVLVRVLAGQDVSIVADNIKRWKHLQAFTLVEMKDMMVTKIIATSARQISLFLIILTIVSITINALIIYTMTMGKIREIAVLKLIGTKNSTIAGMILQESLGLGLIGFVIGRLSASLWVPFFPKYILLQPTDGVIAFLVTMSMCMLSSLVGIYVAMRIDPATAIGG